MGCSKQKQLGFNRKRQPLLTEETVYTPPKNLRTKEPKKNKSFHSEIRGVYPDTNIITTTRAQKIRQKGAANLRTKKSKVGDEPRTGSKRKEKKKHQKFRPPRRS
jgi:hypothetical protein